MAKVKMNQHIRGIMTRFANSIVEPKNETVEERIKCYEAAKAALEMYVRQRYPAEDMQVLDKYNLLASSTHAYVYFKDADDPKVSSTRIVEFQYDKDIDPKGMFRVPHGNTSFYLEDPEMKKALRDYRDIEERAEQEIEEMKHMYYSLINGAKYVDDVLDVWPEVRETVSKYVNLGGQLAPITKELVTRIKADVERRKNLAA